MDEERPKAGNLTVIPRIIHQTWRTRLIPVRCLWWRFRLRRMHARWEYRFYTDGQCRRIIADGFPHLLAMYDAYPHPVQRADMFRVAVVSLHGGFYCDLDIRIHRPLDELCTHPCVLAEEKTLSAEETERFGHRDPLRVANYMFGAEPGHSFFAFLLDQMAARAHRPLRKNEDILESTGPGLMSTAYHDYPGSNIHLLPNSNLKCRRCNDICCQFGPYASHLHLGSWR